MTDSKMQTGGPRVPELTVHGSHIDYFQEEANEAGTKNALAIGIEHHRAGRFENAESIYTELLEELPSDYNALHLKGLVRFQNGDLEHGRELVEKSLKINQKHATIFCTLGIIEMIAGDSDEALESFDKALEINPEHLEALTHKGCVIQTGENQKLAIQCFQKALDNLDG